MKHSLLALAALALILTCLVNSAEATSNWAPAATTIYHDSDQKAVSILVDSRSQIGGRDAESLSEFGSLTTVVGQIAVLHTQTEMLRSIASLPFVSGIEESWSLHAYLDKSVPDIGANDVWNQVRDSLGRNVTGTGVIIGFVDTGIDVSHPDFTFPNGTTKILYVWDQTESGRPPLSFGYGNECNSDDIQKGRCTENDTFGHGTHVAGIAASTGQATGNYTGVAPGASIIFVKSGHAVCSGTGWTFDSTEILDGVNYIVTKAHQLGRRVVINLSLGGNIGGHDGSDPMEIALDQFVEAGTPVVVAAGNQEQDNDHIGGHLAKNGIVTFGITSQQSTTDLAIDIWYPTPDAMDATLATPNGSKYNVTSTTVSSSLGNVTTMGRSTDHGNELYFEISSATTLPQNGWNVTLRAQHVVSGGAWDAWVDTASCANPGASFLPGDGYHIDLNDTIGIPGTAHYVVTVGAYVTKSIWKGLDNQTYGSASIGTGEIAPFSSWGPTRDGRTKPDVTAPGYLIASARSSPIAEKASDPDAFHRILAGTSMAAPHVAGTIALMLQYSPNLEAAKIPQIIRDSARQDSDTGLLYGGSRVWGFGKLDARAATAFLRLTFIANGLPPTAETTVHVDYAKIEMLSDSWHDLYLRPGTLHTIQVDGLVNAESGAQYQLTSANVMIGTKTREINATLLTAPGGYAGINQTSVLILTYMPIPPANTLLSRAADVLALAAIFLYLGLYLVYRKRRLPKPHGRRIPNTQHRATCSRLDVLA